MTSLTRYRASLDFLFDRAGEAGLDALIEPINPRDVPGNFLDYFNFAADLTNAMGHASLKLQFDIYHRQIIYGDVLTGLRVMMLVKGHAQIASVPLRNEPDLRERFSHPAGAIRSRTWLVEAPRKRSLPGLGKEWRV